MAQVTYDGAPRIFFRKDLVIPIFVFTFAVETSRAVTAKVNSPTEL
ncbi:hypothetical protein EVA_08193 [gut metagenome]|uniref:Uncharacterized protein n=1 Tax=gut metagenome TaxID=749906 RepID=J9CU08_9ZZZZ